MQRGVTSDQAVLLWPGPRLLVHLCCTVPPKTGPSCCVETTRDTTDQLEVASTQWSRSLTSPHRPALLVPLPTATWWQAPRSGGQDRPPLALHGHYWFPAGGRWCVVQEAQVHKTTTGQSARSLRPNLAQSNLSPNLLSNQ